MARYTRAMRYFAVLLALLGFATSPALAADQVCHDQLRSALSDAQAARAPTGIDAALLLKRAVDIVEPALPRFRNVGNVPVAKDDPSYDEVRFLLERNLLPGGWGPDAIDAATWQAMLGSFLAWYKITDFKAGDISDVSGMVDDAARAMARVSDAIRPAGLLASDPDDHTRIAFWAIIWNWTVYPRLLVLEPRSDVDLSGGPGPVLQHMGNCAVHVQNYVMAPAETAKQLFLANNASKMYVVGAVPGIDGKLPMAVPMGKELDAFAFALPALDQVSEYAAVFEGPSVGVTTVLGLLPRLRTNMSPPRFMHVMQTP